MARPPKTPSAVATAAQSKRSAGASKQAETDYQTDLDNIEDIANALAALEARVAALESA